MFTGGGLYLTTVCGFSGCGGRSKDRFKQTLCLFMCVHVSVEVLLELDNTICFWMLRGFPVINTQWKVICSNSEIAAGLVWVRGILNDELTETWIVCYLKSKPYRLMGTWISGWLLGLGAQGDLLPVAVRVRLNHVISVSRSRRSDASSSSIQWSLLVVTGWFYFCFFGETTSLLTAPSMPPLTET